MTLTTAEATAKARLPRHGPIKQTLANQDFLAETAALLAKAIACETDSRALASLAGSLARVTDSHDGCVHRVRLLRGQPWVGTAKPPPAKPKRRRGEAQPLPEPVSQPLDSE